MALLPPPPTEGLAAENGAIEFEALLRAPGAVLVHGRVARDGTPNKRLLFVAEHAAQGPLAPNTLVLVERPLAAVCDLEGSYRRVDADGNDGGEAAEGASPVPLPDDVRAAAGGEPAPIVDRLLAHVLRQPGVVHAADAPAMLRTAMGRLTWALLVHARRPPVEPDGSPTPADEVGRPLDAAYFARWFAGASFADGRVVHQWEQFFALDPDNKLDCAHREDLQIIYRHLAEELRPHESQQETADAADPIDGSAPPTAASGGAGGLGGAAAPPLLCDVYAAFGAARMNALEVSTELGAAPLGLALYARAAAANHSCAPNCELQFTDGFTACLVHTGSALSEGAAGGASGAGFALRGDELTISYVSRCVRALPEPMRRQRIVARRYFVCACARCAAERALPAARGEEPVAELLNKRALGAVELSDASGAATAAYEHVLREMYREALAAGKHSGRRGKADKQRLDEATDAKQLFGADWFADLIGAWNNSTVGEVENRPLAVIFAGGELLRPELLVHSRAARASAAERDGAPPEARPVVPASAEEAEPITRAHRARLAGSRILGDTLGVRTVAALASLLVPTTAQRHVVRQTLAALGVALYSPSDGSDGTLTPAPVTTPYSPRVVSLGSTSGGVRGGAAPPQWWAVAAEFTEACLRAAAAYEQTQLLAAGEAAFLERVHELDAAARAWSGGRALVDSLRCELILRPWAWGLLKIAEGLAAQDRALRRQQQSP